MGDALGANVPRRWLEPLWLEQGCRVVGLWRDGLDKNFCSHKGGGWDFKTLFQLTSSDDHIPYDGVLADLRAILRLAYTTAFQLGYRTSEP